MTRRAASSYRYILRLAATSALPVRLGETVASSHACVRMITSITPQFVQPPLQESPCGLLAGEG